jgi:hypothetical protein
MCGAGCTSSGGEGLPAEGVPAGAKLIASGRFDRLVLSAPNGGTVYFVDEGSGEVVYTLPYPPNERAFRLKEAPKEFRETFDQKGRYRIYLAPTGS